MDRRQIFLSLALRELGQNIDLTGFDRRLILQKSVYLLQAAGVNFGYSFSWYLRGPYCSSLTSDLFAIFAELDENLDDWRLDEGISKSIGSAKTFLSQSPVEPDLARWLELLASIHFLVVKKKDVLPEDVDGIQQILSKYKKNYSTDQIRAAMSSLKSAGLITRN